MLRSAGTYIFYDASIVELVHVGLLDNEVTSNMRLCSAGMLQPTHFSRLDPSCLAHP